MTRTMSLVVVAAWMAASTLAVAAQSGGKPTTGNPTPGTAQPDPPNLSDRITLSGCLQPAPKGAAGDAAPDANTPSDARYELTSAQRVDRVPPGTGGSPAAVKAPGNTYRLKGIESQFSPFVNTRVEISGEITPLASGGAPPTLLVEFIQKIKNQC